MTLPRRPLSANSTSFDIVIVGAGPAGSALAIWLAMDGWHVLLVERERFPHHKVCGEFLSPEAQRTLAALGVEQMLMALAPVQLAGARVITATGRTLDLNLPGQAWGISRYTLDAALATAAEQRGAEVRSETTVTHCLETNGGFHVQLRRRHDAASAQPESSETYSVHTRAFVLACGRHGAPAMGSNVAPRRTGNAGRNSNVGIKCHFANVSMPAQVELYLFAGGYIGINPVENGYFNVCALASYEAFGRAGRSPRAVIEAAVQWNPAFGERLHGAHALPATECAVAPVNTWRAPVPWKQVPRIGDTATMIPPLCGDGMAMALRSAELCAPLLAGYLRNAVSWRDMGSQYSDLWRNEFNQRLRMGRLLETMLLASPMADFLLRVGAKMPSVAEYLVRATRGASN